LRYSRYCTDQPRECESGRHGSTQWPFWVIECFSPLGVSASPVSLFPVGGHI
jgi:hypothetical protein